MTARSKPQELRQKARRFMLRIARTLVMAVLAFAGYQWATWPDVAAIAHENPASTAFVDANLRKGGPGSVAWTWKPSDEISPNLKRAVLVAEDINFFSHSGFESHEISQAIQVAVSRKELPRGASTISQQVAKNLWLSPSRNPWRKLKEALLTTQLEHHTTKRRILEVYLNIAQMGPNIFGAEAAAQAYFGKGAAVLNETEAAQLAATLSRPSLWNPNKPSKGYDQRVTLITRRARKAAWLDKRF